MAGERKFVYKNWEYAVRAFDRLSLRKNYAARLRMEYFLNLTEKTGIAALFRLWLENIGSVIKLGVTFLKYQVFGGHPAKADISVVFIIARNSVYIQTLKPVILFLIGKGVKLEVLCAERHFSFIREKLGEKAWPHIHVIESVVYEKSAIRRLLRMLVSFLAAIFNGLWFMFQPVKHRFWFAPMFSRYSFTEYYFGKGLRKYFKTGVKLVSASDQWLWESLYFTVAREAGAESYVLQHGVIGDITYPLFAKQFLAWGKYDADKIQHEYGARPEEVQVIGSPHFEEVYKTIQAHKTESTQFNKPYITFLSQYFFNSNFMEPGYYQQIIDRFCALSDLAKKFGKQLVIKLHPADKKEYYVGLPPDILISTDGLLDVLDKTCLAFTVDSTAIFESLMYGIPTLQCGIEGMIRIQFNFIVGGGGYATNQETMNSFVNTLLSAESSYVTEVNKKLEELSAYFYEVGEGQTPERILNLLN